MRFDKYNKWVLDDWVWDIYFNAQLVSAFMNLSISPLSLIGYWDMENDGFMIEQLVGEYLERENDKN